MILILSSDGDVTTSEVIEWIEQKDKTVVRFNDNDIFNYEIRFYIENDEMKFCFKRNDYLITSDEITVVWFRKFGFYRFAENFPTLAETKNLKLIQQFISEYFSILNLITLCLSKKRWLFDRNKTVLNKFFILKEAQKIGLEIPKSFLLNSKNELSKLVSSFPLISKTIKDGSQISYNGRFVAMFTTEVESVCSAKDNLPDFFMPSLVQEKIEKLYEIRIFYLENKFYSMAIFSQGDEQTKLDFRKYNFENPNRMVPYLLPQHIEKKLSRLMVNLNLNTGSIDMIYTKKKQYVFLEVNQSGQFGMVSKPCNLNLEKLVAEYLIKYS